MNTIILDGTRYRSESSQGALQRDGALIICAPNPFSEGRTWVTMLAGSSTYGVAAAAKYLIEHRGVIKHIRRKQYVRLCEVEVLNGEIAGVTHCTTKLMKN